MAGFRTPSWRGARRVAIIISWCLCTPAVAAPFDLYSVADTATLMPGSGLTFDGFATPAYDGIDVAFYGYSNRGRMGIFQWSSGSVLTVADSTTPVPGGGGFTYGFVQEPSISVGAVGFEGFGGPHGIYWNQTGGLTSLATTQMSLPRGGGSYAIKATNAVSLYDGEAVFWGWGGAGLEGVYRSDGSTTSVVADTLTNLPSSASTFAAFGQAPSFDGQYTVFRGSGTGGELGIYLGDGNTLEVLADRTTAIPDGTGTFTNFANPAGDLGGAAILGYGGGGQAGIYAASVGSLERIADLATPIPGGSGTFTNFYYALSYDDGATLFIGYGVGQEGLYLASGGGIEKVVAAGDALDGKLVSGLEIWNDSLRGQAGTVVVRFADQSSGVYVFEPGSGVAPQSMPEPGTLAFAASAVALAALRRRRREA